MPIFEYRCTDCGDRFDVLVNADHTPPPCPRCGEVKVERMLSAFAVGKASRASAAPGPCGSADCACRARDHHS